MTDYSAFNGIPLEEPKDKTGVDYSAFNGVPLEPAGQPEKITGMDLSKLPPLNEAKPLYGGASGDRQDIHPGILKGIHAALTGYGRKEFDLPEFDLPFEFSSRQAKTALGLMTTFDPKREMSVLKENYPDLTFGEDRFGNIMADASAYGGGQGYINKPGLSVRDLADIGFQTAAFTPAGRSGALATKTLPRMAAVAGSAAATQAGLDVANQMAGGTDEISLANIDKGNMALAAAGGGVFEGVGIIASKLLPTWQKAGYELTDSIRERFKTEAVNQGMDPSQITDDLISKYLSMADDAINPREMTAIRQTDEFGIPYTKGQASGDVKQLNLEDSMTYGGLGPKPQERMIGFREEKQVPAINRAVQKEQARLSGGKNIIETPTAMGEIVGEGIRGRASALDDAIQTAYGQVGEARLSTQGMTGLVTRMRRVAKAGQFETAGDLAPATKSLLTELDDYAAWAKDAGSKLRPVHIRKLETFRKRLNAKYNAAANNTDRRQVLELKRTFDTYLDSAVDRAMFYGDDEALNALKEARGLRAEYAKKYQVNPSRTKSGRLIGDPAGDAIERMISANPTDEQVVNFFYGSTKIGGRNAGAKVAQRVKEIVGEDSQEWKAIREAGFMKIMKPGRDGISGKILAGRLEDALNDSPTLMNTLYSTDEIAHMRRLISSIKRAQPEIGNPSKTSYKASQLIGQAWEQLASMIGFNIGGPAGAVAGKTAAKASGQATAFRATRAAAKAVEGPVRPFSRMNIGQYGSVGAVSD